jgi:hypothetical protein
LCLNFFQTHISSAKCTLFAYKITFTAIIAVIVRSHKNTSIYQTVVFSRPTSINIIVKKDMKPVSLSLLFALLVNLVNANTGLRGNNSIDHQVQEANRFLEYKGHDVSRKLQGKPSGRMEYVQFADGMTYQVKNTPPMCQVGLASGKEIIKISSGAVISSDGSIDMKGGMPDVTNGVFSCNLQGDDAKCTPEQESNFTTFQSGRKLQTGSRGHFCAHNPD